MGGAGVSPSVTEYCGPSHPIPDASGRGIPAIQRECGGATGRGERAVTAQTSLSANTNTLTLQRQTPLFSPCTGLPAGQRGSVEARLVSRSFVYQKLGKLSRVTIHVGLDNPQRYLVNAFSVKTNANKWIRPSELSQTSSVKFIPFD